MDYQSLKTEIETHPEWVGLSDNEIAVLFNEKTLTMVQSRFVQARTIVAEIDDGGEILDAIESVSVAVPAVKWMMIYLKGEVGVDVGYPKTRKRIDDLAAGGILTVEQAETVKAMAVVPASIAEVAGFGYISHQQVAQALRGAL